MANIILCSLSYHIDFTLNLSIFLYFCDKSRALFNSSCCLLCFFVYYCVFNKAYFVATVLLSTTFWSVRAITIFSEAIE